MNKISNLRHIAFILLIITVVTLKATQKNDQVTITGRVINNTGGETIEYATIAAYSQQDKLLTGTITNTDGSFILKVENSKFYLKIDFIGFETLRIDSIPVGRKIIELGDLLLKPSEIALDEIEIRAEKSLTEFKLDKRVFNVGKDIVNAGGSALDVLNNVPSVDVDIEGSVSLRGNTNVKILLNGKPSVMTDNNSLGTITADMLEKIEVITNPSANQDAEGTTGIINLIIKKEEKKGVNGAITVNTGYPTNNSIGFSINRRTECFNLFSQLGVGKRTFLSEGYGETIDRITNSPSTFTSNSNGSKTEQFYHVILGTDYHINKLNVLTLSGQFGYEIEDQESVINYESIAYEEIESRKTYRQEITEAVNPKYEFNLNYKKDWEENQERTLTASAIGSFFGKNSLSKYTNSSGLENLTIPSQNEKTDYGSAVYSFQADYTHPLDSSSTIESGLKTTIDDIYNDYQIDNLVEGIWIGDSAYTNVFSNAQYVSAAYLTYAFERKNFGLKAGVRGEYTFLSAVLENTNESNTQKYFDFFPSLHFSHAHSDRTSFQLGYSRRIHRPHWRQLNPFTSFIDPNNLRTGNPYLNPEYTNAVELTAIHIFKSASLSSALYYRHTTDVISSIVKIKDSLSISTSMNLGTSDDMGLEINGKFEPAKWTVLLLNANIYAYNRAGSYLGTNYDVNSISFSGKLNGKFKLPYDVESEIVVRYRSGKRDLLSYTTPQTFTDFGINKQFINGKLVLNLSISDIFNTRKRVIIYDNDSYYRYNEFRHDGRRVILGLSYGFGKGEAMQYSGQKHH